MSIVDLETRITKQALDKNQLVARSYEEQETRISVSTRRRDDDNDKERLISTSQSSMRLRPMRGGGPGMQARHLS
jgi:hypothetical protein